MYQLFHLNLQSFNIVLIYITIIIYLDSYISYSNIMYAVLYLADIQLNIYVSFRRATKIKFPYARMDFWCFRKATLKQTML